MAKKKESLAFEDAMQKLEDIVQKLEAGKMTLDESLQAFTDGMELASVCENQLEAASGKVEKIMKDLSGNERVVAVNDEELLNLKG